MSATNSEPEPEEEDEGVLTIFFWYDDEPADEDEQWAALYDDWEGPAEEPWGPGSAGMIDSGALLRRL